MNSNKTKHHILTGIDFLNVKFKEYSTEPTLQKRAREIKERFNHKFERIN